MLLGCNDMAHVVWGTRTWYMFCWGAMTWNMLSGGQGHGTCCWGAMTWHMLLGDKDNVTFI